MVHRGGRSGVRRAGAGLGLAVVAVVWALSIVSPGVAGASPSRGAEARPAPALKQQAELTASDAAQLDIFGQSVAVSGSTAVVGAPSHNSEAGAAYVFVRSGTTWIQQAELTASDAASYAQFGWSVAVSGSGSTVVVGAPQHDVGTGAAYVFVRSGTTWTQQAELTASDGASGDQLGWSVAASGSTAVVGAEDHNSFTGAAYVFVRSGTTWTQQAELTASDGASGDELGFSVAVSGSTAVAGALGHNSSAGVAYVFVRSGTSWSQQAELSASDAASGDQFGWSVGVSGSTAVIGAPFHNSTTGKAYVFARSGTTWTQQAELSASATASGGEFGLSVAVSGSTAVIGAPFHNSSTGKAYVFVRSGTAWPQRTKLTSSDSTSGDTFARSVAVSRSTAVVGAPGHNSDTGVAYVFQLPST